MRIFLPSHHWADPTLGAPGADHRLAAALRALGHEAETFFFDDAFRRWRSPGRWAQLFFPWIVARNAMRRAASGNLDVLETTAGDGWIMRLALSRKLRRPLFVARTHGIERRHFLIEKELAAAEGRTLSWRSHVYHGGFRLWEVERDLRRADFIVVHGREDEAFAIDSLGIERERVFVIPCGIAEEFFAPVPPFDAARVDRILFLGSWIPRKGIHLLPEIVERMASTHPAVRWTLAGTGAGEAEVLRGFGPSAASRVTVVPRIENSEVPALMSRHGTFFFPSRAEGFGLVLVEAMARGLVVVSTRVGIATELLIDGQNGFVAEEPSIDRLESALLRVLEGRGELPVVARSARLSSEAFSWRRSAETRVQLYRRFSEELLAGSARSVDERREGDGR